MWQPIQKFNHFFRSKRLSIPHKIRIFKAYVETTLLYNSETWALTATLEESLNSFHRRILRIAINIRYPKKISSKNLYILTKETPISDRIRKRRIALFGHVLRLNPDTPAQKALLFHIVPRKRPVGHPHATWLALITKDIKKTLQHHNIKLITPQQSLNRKTYCASKRQFHMEEGDREE